MVVFVLDWKYLKPQVQIQSDFLSKSQSRSHPKSWKNFQSRSRLWKPLPPGPARDNFRSLIIPRLTCTATWDYLNFKYSHAFTQVFTCGGGDLPNSKFSFALLQSCHWVCFHKFLKTTGSVQQRCSFSRHTEGNIYFLLFNILVCFRVFVAVRIFLAGSGLLLRYGRSNPNINLVVCTEVSDRCRRFTCGLWSRYRDSAGTV